MKILVDLNVWIDIASRPKSFPDSSTFFTSAEATKHHLTLPLSGYTTIFYLLEQIIGKKGSINFLRGIQQRGVELIPFTPKEVTAAQALPLRDFEDACVVASAMSSLCDLIVTRNVKDFKNSPIKALEPKQALKKL